jgi:pyruvate dehydrogenase (quinone)
VIAGRSAGERDLRGRRGRVALEAVVDPDVPPLPPHITFEQAASMTRALLKGDPDAAGIVRQSMRELAAGVRAHVS